MSVIEEHIRYLAVKAWQADEMMHSMTCGACSIAAEPLLVIKVDGFTATVCGACGYRQFFIPAVVIERFLDQTLVPPPQQGL